MQTISILLTDTAGRASTATGTLTREAVTREAYVYADAGGCDASIETAEIRVGSHVVVLQGVAWREIEDADCLDNFVRLLFLSQVSAERVVAIAQTGGPYYSALCTRDLGGDGGGTESCTHYTTINEPDDVLDEVKEADARWEPNDSFSEADPYFGDKSNDIEQVDLDDVISGLLADAKADAETEARQKAFDLIISIAQAGAAGRTQLLAKEILENALYPL